MQYYSYDEFREDIKRLLENIDFQPEAIVAISRGGLTIAHFLGIALDIRKVYTINVTSYTNKTKQSLEVSHIPEISGIDKILLVDEIVDSGLSMQKVFKILKEINSDLTIKTASIFYKEASCFKPDYYIREAKSWIEFFWEVDISKEAKV